MSNGTVKALPGGLVLSRPSDTFINAEIYNLPLQPLYYLPLVNYSRTLVQPTVATGELVRGGQSVAPGIIAPTSGVVIDQVEHPWSHTSRTSVPTLILQANMQDTFVSWKPLDRINVSVNDKLARIDQAGVHGLGGAAFSSATKIRQVLKCENRTLIINAVECEPGICCDDALIQQHAKEVIDACTSLLKWLDIPSVSLAIEDDKACAIKKLQQALEENNPTIQLAVLPTIYPSGAEAPLVQRITGITLAKDQRAADMGVLCLNVATVLSIHRALQGYAAIDRVISITTQDLKHSINIRARFGTPISAILSFACHHSNAIAAALNQNSSSVRIGGPLSGFTQPQDNSPVLATTNTIMVGKEVSRTKPSPCIRCSECSLVCPVNLLPQELYSASKTKDTSLLARYSLNSCVLCGCCDLVCPASIPLTDWFRYAKDLTDQQDSDAQAAKTAEQRSKNHTLRVQRRAAEKTLANAQRTIDIEKQKSASADIKAALERVRNKRPKS